MLESDREQRIKRIKDDGEVGAEKRMEYGQRQLTLKIFGKAIWKQMIIEVCTIYKRNGNGITI